MNDHAAAIDRGLRYLARQQKRSGGFASFSSPSKQPFRTEHSYQTTLVPSLILGALSTIDTPASHSIRQDLAQFLLAQKSSHWTYNYWARRSPEATKLPYPDDLDDTFCALNALVLHDPSLADEAMLVAAVKTLLASETTPGGPYRTWLVPADSEAVWLDTDLAVNANVAYFLSLVSQPLPQLVYWLDAGISQKRLVSPYYPSAVPLIYYLARHYTGQKRAELVRHIRHQLPQATGSLETALLLTAAKRLGIALPKKWLTKLLLAQAGDGSWPAEAFCIDPARDGKTFYHGAAALTTALALEALQVYHQAAAPTTHLAKQQDDQVLRRVIKLAHSQVIHLQPELRLALMAFMQKVLNGSNGQEITELSAAFNASLRQPLRRADAFLDNLALGNLYGWAAYTIYDDFLDEEGKPTLVSVANAAHRRSLKLFQASGLDNFADQIFDTIDSANAWEIAHCRFPVTATHITIGELPNFGRLDKLAERSMGHTLGPICILKKRGYNPASPESRAVQKSLQHYLIARQLNDDAHDWQADLTQGQITYVVAIVLRGIKPGEHSLTTLLPRLQKKFWHQTLPMICDTMERQVALSRRSLRKSQALQSQNIITKLLDDLEESIQTTRREQAQAEKFLKQYQKR